MASERDDVLTALGREVVQVEASAAAMPSTPSENMAQALSEGERTKQLALSHEHQLKMKRADLGWFGVLFGGESHASIVIAFVVVILGFAGAIGLWALAFYTGKQEFWSSEAHVSLAAATSALGYVFGRGSKDSK